MILESSVGVTFKSCPNVLVATLPQLKRRNEKRSEEQLLYLIIQVPVNLLVATEKD